MDKVLNDLYETFGHHPLFAKLRRVDIKDSPIYKKGAELADDIRDKYETSDHPAVHKVEVRQAAAWVAVGMVFMRGGGGYLRNCVGWESCWCIVPGGKAIECWVTIETS
jgi:hypothetical protein